MLAALRRGAAAQTCLLHNVVAEALPSAAASMLGSVAAAAAAIGSRSCRPWHQPFSAAAGGSSAHQSDSGQHFVIASSTPVTKRLWQR